MHPEHAREGFETRPVLSGAPGALSATISASIGTVGGLAGLLRGVGSLLLALSEVAGQAALFAAHVEARSGKQAPARVAHRAEPRGELRVAALEQRERQHPLGEAQPGGALEERAPQPAHVLCPG